VLPTLWLVSPLYLDVESYLRLRREVREALTPLQGTFARVIHVAVDDSGGFDREVTELLKLDDVRVVYPPFNLGHQRALVYGLRSLAEEIEDRDYVVTLDADGEDRPSDVIRLLAPLLEAPDDLRCVSIARRTKRHEALPFKVLYLLFRILFRSATGVIIRSGNFAAYRGWLARRLLFHPHFDLCYSSVFISLNVAAHFIPAERGLRFAGRSRMSYAKLLMHGVRMLLPFTDVIAIRALVGFAVVFGASLAVLLGSSLMAASGSWPLPQWASVAASVALLLSFVAVGNLIVLFAAFTQARGTSLKHLEKERGAHAPEGSLLD
jgi:hypothetical protein